MGRAAYLVSEVLPQLSELQSIQGENTRCEALPCLQSPALPRAQLVMGGYVWAGAGGGGFLWKSKRGLLSHQGPSSMPARDRLC